MLRAFWLGLVWTAGLAHALAADSALARLLDSKARVIETAAVGGPVQPSRTLVLWMISPALRDAGEEYCGTAVHGQKFWEGPLRLSLVDGQGAQVLQTLKILGRDNQGDFAADSFLLPASIRSGYYRVRRPGPDGLGIPEILQLRDFTGDGVAAEFALFVYDACGIAHGSVFGYDRGLDSVAQYPVEIHADGKTRVELWTEQVFARRAIAPGRWDFTWPPAHGDDRWFRVNVRFDPAARRFIEERAFVRSPRGMPQGSNEQ
jgi:hypothetical protein